MIVGYQIDVLRTRAALDSLSGTWPKLTGADINPLLTHHWFAAAAEALHENFDLRVLTLERQGHLVAVAPMTSCNRMGSAWLEVIGSPVLHEPTGILSADPQARDALCVALISQQVPFLVSRVEQDQSLLDAMRQASRGRGHIAVARSAPCFSIDISGHWNDYLSGRSSEMKSGFRRKRRVLERSGQVSVEFLHPSQEDFGHILQEALDVEADSWKGRQGSAILQNRPLRNFVYSLGSRFAATGQLQVSFLRVAGQAIAMNILLEYGNRLWEIKVGYRDAWRGNSPGMLLLWETLRNAFERGLSGYEFLGSGDGQQPAWANSSRQLWSLVHYPFNLSGLLAYFGMVAKRLVARFG